MEMRQLIIWNNRFRKFLDNPVAIIPFFKKRFYYNLIADNYIDKYKDTKFLSYEQTINEILCNNKSIVRFGDDVFDFLLGIGLYFNNWKQVYKKDLANKLESVLALNNKRLLICFNPEFILKSKKEFIREGIGNEYQYWINSKIFLAKYINKNQIYGRALAFQEKYNKNFPYSRVKEYLKTKNLVIVTSKICRFNNKNFGETTQYIEGPTSNAWSRYNEIKEQIFHSIKKLPKEKTLILISLGPVSKILILDLTERGYTAWDTGQFFDISLKKITE
ncbi:MAG: hypothetical protein COU06_00445 [Candidatus Harrisonbacteria bacterium CG10_big_fil_rev_8_21_14_0_10_38_8]|uniref:Glycosyltransferase GT-D fold domain-containing protein n=1 Tax=Candidatus Harrisonbacteria bacterium CG10_big_fil_rev_8_21_14_0_10_38_8 TaxID=1974582 RepID=A0A2M6WKN7_9BACT|nr:MAG: hypothetical protein COU06_00445 [Candidatus Harrisonbacteria bacterium CG10_big_fil_rev_8_21_14_0_10_38_8]